MIFFFCLQSPEEKSFSQRAPSTGHASEDPEGWGRDVHGERMEELSDPSDRMVKRGEESEWEIVSQVYKVVKAEE